MSWRIKALLVLLLAQLSGLGVWRFMHWQLRWVLILMTVVFLLGLLSLPVWYFSFPARATRLVTKGWGHKDEKAHLRRVWRRRHVWELAWRMPAGATPSFFIHNREALEVGLNSSVAIWEKHGLVRMRFGVRRLADRVDYSSFVRGSRPAGELPLPLGDSREGRLWPDLAKIKNLLIAGAIGGGKSTVLNAIIVWIAEHRPQTRLMLFDLKGEDGVEFGLYNSLPQLVRPVVTRLEEVEDAFDQLQAEYIRRYQMLRAAGVKKLEDYNALKAELKLAKGLPVRIPRLVVMMDEFAQLQAIPKPALNGVMMTVEGLTRTGRAAGIHFILATQRPEVSVVSGQIRNNVLAVLGFYCGDEYTSGIVLGPGDFRAHTLDPEDPGLAIWKYRTSTKVRTAWLSASEAEARVKKLGGITVTSEPLPALSAPQLESEEPEPEPEPLGLAIGGWLLRTVGRVQRPLTLRISTRWQEGS